MISATQPKSMRLLFVLLFVAQLATLAFSSAEVTNGDETVVHGPTHHERTRNEEVDTNSGDDAVDEETMTLTNDANEEPPQDEDAVDDDAQQELSDDGNEVAKDNIHATHQQQNQHVPLSSNRNRKEVVTMVSGGSKRSFDKSLRPEVQMMRPHWILVYIGLFWFIFNTIFPLVG